MSLHEALILGLVMYLLFSITVCLSCSLEDLEVLDGTWSMGSPVMSEQPRCQISSFAPELALKPDVLCRVPSLVSPIVHIKNCELIDLSPYVVDRAAQLMTHRRYTFAGDSLTFQTYKALKDLNLPIYTLGSMYYSFPHQWNATSRFL